MSDPKPGERFWDKDLGCVVTYLGDHGQGPRWKPGGREPFYCDWCDYYLWDRFERLQ